MSTRVTDSMVTDWLIWARNFGEIVSYSTGRGPWKNAKKGESRRFRIRLTPGMTKDGSPFRLKEGILDLFGHRAEDVVPSELMLTAREALLFGMGCAAGRVAALAGVGKNKDWRRDKQEEWTPEVQAAFKALHEEAHTRDKQDFQRERDEWEAERQERIEEYRRRKTAASRVLERGDDLK